jgi:hypothetical protein
MVIIFNLSDSSNYSIFERIIYSIIMYIIGLVILLPTDENNKPAKQSKHRILKFLTFIQVNKIFNALISKNNKK